MTGESYVSRKCGYSLASRGACIALLSGLALVACDGDGNGSKGDGGASGGDGDSNMDGGRGGDGDSAVAGGDGDNGPNGNDGGQTPGPDAGPLCSPACADTNNCTADECVAANTCTHALDPSLCPQGQSCHPMTGCAAGAACSMPGDCADDDGCTTNERCDGVSATCQFDPLDGDNDGFAPAVCGGGDCNDAAGNVNPGETERCNNQDDDCDGTVDDNAVCSGGRICVSGNCVCPEGQMQCGGGGGGGGGGPVTCADLKTSADHCGECGNDCGPAGVCSNSQCTCPAPGTMCGDTCVDTQTSFDHCGGCNMECELQPVVEACVGGDCVACGNAGEPCCAPLGPFAGCFSGLSCSGTPNTAGAVCQCANTMCGDACVDTKTSEAHCGGCNQPCEQGQQCKASAGGAGTCSDCGGMGEDCCQVGQFGVCFSGGTTCNQQTQKCVAGGGGGPGGGGIGPGNN